MKPCPFCAEQIQDAAIKCRYCGSLLDQAAATPPTLASQQTAASPPSYQFDDARELARQGHKINAIRLVREKTGWGLKEAKDFVESPAFGVPSTTKASTSGGGVGCLVVILLIAGAVFWRVGIPSPQSPTISPSSAATASPPTPQAVTAPPMTSTPSVRSGRFGKYSYEYVERNGSGAFFFEPALAADDDVVDGAMRKLLTDAYKVNLRNVPTPRLVGPFMRFITGEGVYDCLVAKDEHLRVLAITIIRRS